MPPKFRSDHERSREPERQALLDGNSDEDDFFLRGPTAQPGRLLNSGDNRLQQIESEIDGVVGIMRDNIDKTMQRGERLDDLQDKSDDLASNADVFRIRSKTLRNRMWWKECRVRLLIAAVIAIILTIIIVAIVMKHKK